MSGADAPFVADPATSLAASDPEGYGHFAVRTRSPLAREVLAAAGADAVLGEVLGLSHEEEAQRRGLALLDGVVARDGAGSLPPRALRVWADLLVTAGRDDEVLTLVRRDDVDLAERERWRLRTDLLNPHRTTGVVPAGEEPARAEARWLRVLGHIFLPGGLERVRLRPAADGATPHQRLDAPVADSIDGDLVTVVMSAHRPGGDLLPAVRSVLAQTWRNLELLLVDDASPPGFEELLEQAAALDPRVRLVRAERNRGTFAVRNLALSLARGRWVTFQDSDDWTHPRRIERQVGHLLGTPGVLANRTRALRAHPDLTMTFVGYAAERLNSSSLLFERLEVARLVGDFDETRKAGDTEFPARLEVAAPGSVVDLEEPGPLAITQLRPGSLSRADMLPGWASWDRLAYRDGYREWHERIRLGRDLPVLPRPSGRRPFPLPSSSWACDPPAGDVPSPEVVVLGDVRRSNPRAPRALGVARACAASGRRTAVAEGEVPHPLVRTKPALLPALVADVRLGRLGRTDVREGGRCDLLVVTDPASVLHLDGAALRPRRVLVVADEPAATDWSRVAVDRRCLDLFGVTPRWGGPVHTHDGPGGPSPLRREVPDDRWCEADLPVVAGGRWHHVGGASAPLRTRRDHVARGVPVVIGHHLRAAGAWPTDAGELRSVLPRVVTLPGEGGEPVDVAVELHVRHRLRRQAKALGLPVPPPSWVSFAGTGMTARELLAHLDVWIHFGPWDVRAEVAALEALGAGLPCVLGPDAAASGLEGPVRCVPPRQARSAIEELVTAREGTPTSADLRQSAWERALR